MTQSRSPTGVLVGFSWVMEGKLCLMLMSAGKGGLTGQRLATGKAQL
jgi:hypothetical protein